MLTAIWLSLVTVSVPSLQNELRKNTYVMCIYTWIVLCL